MNKIRKVEHISKQSDVEYTFGNQYSNTLFSNLGSNLTCQQIIQAHNYSFFQKEFLESIKIKKKITL